MRSQGGFTYLGLLLAIALVGIGLASASEVWSTTMRRQRVEQLEWVGQQFAHAIGSYYEGSPQGIKVYPREMTDLLEDRRFGFRRRHLRQVYVDPFGSSTPWDVVIAQDGGIRGVRSRVPDQSGSGFVVREFVYVPATP
jgi:type II secretory pathway pseudopilin PulG